MNAFSYKNARLDLYLFTEVFCSASTSTTTSPYLKSSLRKNNARKKSYVKNGFVYTTLSRLKKM